MKKFFGIKIKISIFVIILISASLACNYKNRDAVKVIADAAMENCFAVSRSQYESSAAQLGETPKTPKYPESAVYEVCQVDGQTTSVRMTDGNSTEDKDGVTIPPGKYSGEFTDTEMATKGLIEWHTQGAVERNEVILHIADDGTVSGEYYYDKIGNIATYDESHGTACISYNDQYFFGKASGKVTSKTGNIVFDIKQEVVSYYEGCAEGLKGTKNVQEFRQHFEIEFMDGVLTGRNIPHVEDGNLVKGTFVVK